MSGGQPGAPRQPGNLEFGGGRRPAGLGGPGVAGAPPVSSTIGDWLEIDPQGNVTVFTGKVEVGQNLRTSLTQAVADELRLPPSAVTLVMGDTERVPFDRGTFGSQSTPSMATQLRKAAAAARERLMELAADRWESDRSALVVADGKVAHAETGQSLTFGELAGGRRLAEPVTDDAPVTPAERWTVAGTSVPKLNAEAFVTGTHRYSSDVRLPGMLFGKVLRPPAYNATLKSVETRAAEAFPGVQVVREGDFVGVVAPDSRTAALAVEAIHAEWDVPPQPSAGTIYEYLRTHEVEPENPWERPQGASGETGSVEAGLKEAAHTLRRTYTVAYIAHSPLEPRAAVAEWADGALTVWTGTQRPFGVHQQLMEAFQLPPERVHVIVPDTGSGYGGKHTGEAALEAARLARAAGHPVKVVWTREEEFTWAYFRPAGVIEITGGVAADGSLVAWEAHNYNSGAGALRPPYAVPNQRIQFHAAASPLRQGSYRALAATANVFAREVHVDELAELAGIDALAFRLKNLDDARQRAVLEAAAERFGWGHTPAAPHHGFGLACGTEKGSYVATCAEVAVDPDTRQVRLLRVVEAFECGAVVNPDHLRSQIEGAVVQAIGGALFEAIDFADGRILNPRFSEYRVPRFGDVPKIETVLVNRPDLPSTGAGETPIVGLAPAVANAIYRASGVRLRAMPLRLP